MLGKFENVGRTGAAPFINALVVVPNGHVVTIRRGDEVKDLGLRPVDILKLIDEYMCVMALYGRTQLRKAHQRLPSCEQHVIKGNNARLLPNHFKQVV